MRARSARRSVLIISTIARDTVLPSEATPHSMMRSRCAGDATMLRVHTPERAVAWYCAWVCASSCARRPSIIGLALSTESTWKAAPAKNGSESTITSGPTRSG